MTPSRLLVASAFICLSFPAAASAQPMKPGDGAPPPGADRVITRADAAAGAERLFAAMDLNKDGRIDQADRDMRMGRMFDYIDTNHDGAISRAEFLAAHRGMEGGGGMGAGSGMEHGEMPREGMAPGAMHARAAGLGMMLLREADPQHTGTVTHDAFIAAALARFDKSDVNHDGKLTPEERRAAMPMRDGAMREGWHRMGGHADMAPPPED